MESASGEASSPDRPTRKKAAGALTTVGAKREDAPRPAAEKVWTLGRLFAQITEVTTMAKKKKSGGRNWKPGQSGNPGGRPKLPDDLKKLLKMSRVDVERAIVKFMHSPSSELMRVMSDDQASAIEQLFCSVMLKAIEDGDERKLDMLLNRTIGKVADKLDAAIYPKPTIIERLDGSAEVLGAEMDGEEK